MIKLLKCLFVHDWEIVYVSQGSWTVTTKRIDCCNPIKRTEYCIYKIYYSKLRDKYKLLTFGYKPELHHEYISAIQELNRIRNK